MNVLGTNGLAQNLRFSQGLLYWGISHILGSHKGKLNKSMPFHVELLLFFI